MRFRPIVCCSCLVFLFLSSPLWAQESQEQKPHEQTPHEQTPHEQIMSWAKPLAQLELSTGDSIVFLGDSITHQCLYTQYVEDYFYTHYPKMRLKIHNAGVGGAVAWDALQRFDEDVAAYQPKYVSILLGMNDGRYRPYQDDIFQTYRHDMTELLERLQSIGATAIPMTPTMFDARARRISEKRRKKGPPQNSDNIQLYNSVLTYYGTWLRDVAVMRGLGFVDMWGPLNNITLEQRKKDADFTMIADAVHPGPAGQVVMAVAMIEDLGLPRKVSSIRIATHNKNKPVRATGGTLTDLALNDQGIKFTWLADSLPWVVPEEAQLGVKLTRLGHRFSREGFTVLGLATGQYQLLIDGQSVGRYSAAALAAHIELQANDKTPQYQQAQKVAELNKQRNEGPVRSLRNEWGQFQRFARARRAAQASPENQELQKQLATLEAKIEGMSERVASFNKEAKQMEDKIFTINQPQPRQYELKRVRKGS
ncbi:MAG: SGNH/GDSL hydrolase family protein [Pirellulales bacterium]